MKKIILAGVFLACLAGPVLAGVDENGKVAAGPILTSGKKLYSQFNEELIVRDYFNDKQGGVFLDVGCSHYRKSSMTYYLEKHLGWSGIAVDALPELRTEYEANRPRTKFFNYIVTDHSGTKDAFYRVNAATQLSSVHKKNALDAASRRKAGAGIEELQVPTITLNELLEANGIKKIDFLSMDIQGAELAALTGFDIARYRPELVCVERRYYEKGGGLAQKKKIFHYFHRYGYELIEAYLPYDKLNWYFRPKK